MNPGGPATIYVARTIITMDDECPRATAVGVRDGRVVAVGDLDHVVDVIGPDHVLDETFADAVLCAGFIDQHLHPFLGASTLTTEVIAPEDWVLPERTFPAAQTPAAYDARIREAHEHLPAGEWLFSWGYHALWHGELSRSRLDALTGDRPTAIWQRSVHEWYINSAATDALGITVESMSGLGIASEQLDVERGHYWENGWMLALGRSLMPIFLTETRMRNGLHLLVDYLHMNGVTAINEPGVFWAIEPWSLYQEILGAHDVPFLSTFMVEARTQPVRGIEGDEALAESRERIAAAGTEGKVAMVERQVKLFCDGAIVSQLMQMADPYVDEHGDPDPHHHGEWIMEPDELRRMFDVYWDDDWQIHIHVNGDLGLEVLLEIIEDAQRRHPRTDHRTVIVHFANSTEAQVDRIADVGAIVSANPYYPVGFADRYGQWGLGPQRADQMVRAASVLRAGVPLSYHSDLPICASDPLAMASWGVNRITPSGRVAGPDQRVSVHDALRAITIESAFSWRREHDLGSITPGKWANLTVLDDDPYEVDPTRMASIRVLGTIFEGRWHPVPESHADRRVAGHAESVSRAGMIEPCEQHGHLCGCEVAEFIAEWLGGGSRPAA
ncbi:MAG: amidohydrolase [Actinomycetota bacterium]|nr:amidohydrolase [Actinomycetota bacterium]MDA3029109.1 amidohydrolase [Actinomycetota bacterium]